MNKKRINIIFFGTHQFACVILEALLNNPDICVDLVITQPDRPAGRNQKMQKSPVKLLAEQKGLTIDQPSSLKGYQLSAVGSRFAIVAQYGLIIPKHILEAFPLGILNVHTSLLPKYRGASPIQTALMNGETETGVTIMKMDIGMDTGLILRQKKLAIEPDDTYLDLDKKLAILATQILPVVIPEYIFGSLEPILQDNASATFTKLLTKEDGKIDWTKTNLEIYNLFRGLTPWPGVWTMWNDKRLKLTQIRPSDFVGELGRVAVNEGRLFIGCAQGSIEVTKLQLEGKKIMGPTELLNGYKDFTNSNLHADPT